MPMSSAFAPSASTTATIFEWQYAIQPRSALCHGRQRFDKPGAEDAAVRRRGPVFGTMSIVIGLWIDTLSRFDIPIGVALGPSDTTRVPRKDYAWAFRLTRPID